MLIKEKIINQNYKFIITGATGWLGRALIEKLYSYFGNELQNNVMAISASSDSILLQNGYKLETYAYDSDFLQYDKYVLCHFAFLTMDKVSSMKEKEYIDKNLSIRQNVAKISRKLKPKSILLASSGAAYQPDNLYGKLKLEDEVFFKDLASDIKSNIIMPRIFNIGGPYINKHNLYALSDFIVQLINTKRIIINASCPVIRSYIHINDIFKICFNWLFDSKNTTKNIVFDTKNIQEVELEQLANMIIKYLNMDGEVIRNNYDDTLQPNKYVGDSSVQDKLCKDYKIILQDYKNIISDTYNYLKNA